MPNNEKYTTEYQGKDIQIKEFFMIMKKRLWIVVLITILATVGGYYYSNQNNIPQYQTSTRIIVEADESYMSTLMVMIKDPIIMDKVKEELNVGRSPEGIASQIEVTRVDDSKVIMIGVTDQQPKTAADIANYTAKVFKNEAGKLLEFDDVQLLSEAKQNNSPVSENKDRLIYIAAILGLVAGVGLVFLIDSLDDTIEKENQVEEVLGVPVIGAISNMKSKKLATKKKSQKNIEWRRSKVGIKD